MAKPATFTLPAGVEIELSDGTLSVNHAGDVVLEQAFGQTLKAVHAGGDLTVRLAKVTGMLSAGGTLTVYGDVDAVSLRAARIVIHAVNVQARAISASESIAISAPEGKSATLNADAIVAPAIALDSGTAGRVTVIDSQNERVPTKIKGGFSLSDYDEMIGNSAQFLTDLGIPAPGTSTSTTGKVAPKAKPAKPAPAPAAAAAPVEEEEEEVLLAPAPTAKRSEDDDEDIDDPLSISLEDLEPLNDTDNDSDAAVRARLQEALRRITACYDGGPDTPPAVSELRSLVEDGDVEALSQNITSVWNGLLGFHQKRGIRPHHQVTHAFNVIHSLVS